MFRWYHSCIVCVWARFRSYGWKWYQREKRHVGLSVSSSYSTVQNGKAVEVLALTFEHHGSVSIRCAKFWHSALAFHIHLCVDRDAAILEPIALWQIDWGSHWYNRFKICQLWHTSIQLRRLLVERDNCVPDSYWRELEHSDVWLLESNISRSCIFSITWLWYNSFVNDYSNVQILPHDTLHSA